MVLNVSDKAKEFSESNGKSLSSIPAGIDGDANTNTQQSASPQVRPHRKPRSDKGIPRKRRTDSSFGPTGRTPAPIRPSSPTAKAGKKSPSPSGKSVEEAVKKSFFSIFKL